MFANTLDAAHQYHRAGLAVLPVPRGEKAPRLKHWQDFRIRHEAELPRWFGTEPNVGILMGEPSGIVDIDLDVPEAIELAPRYLPVTRTFGRASKPRSHWIYMVDSVFRTSQFRDPTTQAMLVELRGTGGQTVFPPSVHPSAEVIAWTDEPYDIARVHGDELRLAVGHLAAAVLELRHPGVAFTVTKRWRGEATTQVTSLPAPAAQGIAIVDRARRYLARMPEAIEGQGGNITTYKAALAMVKGFDLTDEQAMYLLGEYNQRCQPMWTEADMLQKVRSARAASTPAGYLLRGGR